MEFIDISKWNGEFNFDASRKQGVDGVFIKASGCGVNGNYADYKFEQNSKNCNMTYKGAYHYFDYTGKSGADQCKFFLDTVGSWGNMRGVLDLEDNSGGGWPKLSSMYGVATKEALQFVMQYLRETEVIPVMYLNTGLTILRDSMLRWTFRNFTECPLWVANYNKIASPPTGAWKDYAAWQYTSKGPGILYGNSVGNNYIDLNVIKNLDALLIKPPVIGEDNNASVTLESLDKRLKIVESKLNL